MSASVLIVSRHDYRTNLRASVHFIADALRNTFDEVNFASVAFSPLIRASRDARHPFAATANTWETVAGVRCFLWSMPWHPVSAGGALAQWASGPAFDLWAAWPCPELDAAARRAAVILIQSGPAAALVRRLRRVAPQARIIYRAADLLPAAGVHPRVQRMLERDADLVDRVVVVARAMRPHFAAFGDRVAFVPHGLDPEPYDQPSASPYGPGRHAVSIGAMLFDPSVIQIAATSFPDTTFHLIGTPGGHRYPPNVRQYGTMPFLQTIPYLRHADAGIAAYAEAADSEYLVDSSLKLMQFGYLGIPAVCPAFAVGDKLLRFGYEPGRSASVRDAFRRAFAMQPGAIRVPAFTWDEVCRRMVGDTPIPVHAPPAAVLHDG